MAHFHIDPGTPSLKLPGGRQGQFSFTVSNNLGRPARIQASILPDGATQPAWLSVEGEAERDLAATETQTIIVRVNVPANEPVGDYRFRLLVATVARPDDEYDTSPPVSFSVPPAAPQHPFPWWIVAVAAALVVIAGGGFALFKALRHPRTVSPDAGTEAPVGSGAFTFLPQQQSSGEQDWSVFNAFVGDVNGDGRADLIWNQTSQRNRIYVALAQANGAFTFLPAQERAEQGWSGYKTLVGDVNGDGRADLIWNETAQGNRTYVGLGQADGTLAFLPVQDRVEQGWSGYKTLVADVNNDRRADLIWNETAQGNRTYVGLGQADGTFAFLPFQDRAEQGWGGYVTLVGDVNGDGRADLIWNELGVGNRTYVGLGQTNGTFAFLPFQDRAEQFWSGYVALVGDVNGDRRADLIWNQVAQGNRTYVGLGQTDGTFRFLPFQDRTEQGWTGYTALAGDVNGDRRADLVWNVTGDVNRTYVGLGQASGTFEFLPAQDEAEQSWTGYGALVGDVNGDGRTDLIWNKRSQVNRIAVALANAPAP